MAAIYLLPNTLGQDNFDSILPKDVVAMEKKKVEDAKEKINLIERSLAGL